VPPNRLLLRMPHAHARQLSCLFNIRTRGRLRNEWEVNFKEREI
jgi:hypothetical protein